MISAFPELRTSDRCSVIVIETMPVTAVGKIFKPMLRLEATRRAIEEAVADLEDVQAKARLDDRRAIVAEMRCARAEDQLAAEARVGKFSIAWTIV